MRKKTKSTVPSAAAPSLPFIHFLMRTWIGEKRIEKTPAKKSGVRYGLITVNTKSPTAAKRIQKKISSPMCGFIMCFQYNAKSAL